MTLSLASGDVHISHGYSTEGGDVVEEVYLHNLDYSNEVSIYQDSLFAEAASVLSDKDEESILKDHIVTQGDGKLFGVNLKAGAEDKFEHGMSLSTGNQAADKTTISYNLQSGLTQADYYTNGGVVSEDVMVDNVNYANKADIYPQSLFGSGNANLIEGMDDGVGRLFDAILVDSHEGDFGTLLETHATEQLSLNKNYEAGSSVDAKSDVAYTFESGKSAARYFNPSTFVGESISTDSGTYRGLIKNAPDKLHSVGHGSFTESDPEADPGEFTHDIRTVYAGKPCEIDASLATGSEIYGSRTDAPVVYNWDTSVDSDAHHAKTTVDTKAANGNRDVGFSIEGKSIGLTDKMAGPMHISPLGFIGISKELYMSYEITR